MHEMRTIATDDPVAWCVYQSLFVDAPALAKAAERIEFLCVMDNSRNLRNMVLFGCFDFPTDSMRPSTKYFGRLHISH